MEYGVCGSPEIAPVLERAGYDYIELHVQRDLKPTEGDEETLQQLQFLQSLPVPSTVANCFVPGSLKITGPDADLGALEAYAATALRRAEVVGIDVIVFGSGGARRIPDGYSRDSAWSQLLDFGRMVAALAQQRGITIAVEPLNLRECNVLNTVGESASLVRQVDHPSLRLLVDAYHWGKDNDSYRDLVEALPLVRHAHIATYKARMAPGLEPCDFGTFFQALEEGGYDGRLSVEGKWKDLESDAEGVLAVLRELSGE